MFKADEEEIAFKRKIFLIFQGVKEPTAVSPEEKYEEDLSKVQKVAREAGLQEGVVVKAMTRLNTTGVAREPILNRPRLLKVVLQNEETKWNLLKANGKLKESNDQEMRKIKILPDRTFKERKAHAGLAKVHDSKNKELQEKGITDRMWVIRNKKLKEIRIKVDQGAVGGELQGN